MNRLKKRFVFATLAFLSLFFGGTHIYAEYAAQNCAPQAAPISGTPETETRIKKSISIIQIVEHPALNATRQGILDELASLGWKVNDYLMVSYDSAQGNAALAVQIAQKYVSQNPDLIVALGTTAAQSLVKPTKDKPIPVVFASITDPVGAKLVHGLAHTQTNFTGTSNFIALEPQLEFYKAIVPHLKNLGIIYNAGEVNSIRLVAEYQKIAPLYGVHIQTMTVNRSGDVKQAASSLIGKVDAFLITNDNTALSAIPAIVAVGMHAHLPVFASDTDTLSSGVTAALGPNQYTLGLQTGKMIDKILRGAKVDEVPVEFPQKIEIHLNKSAAEKIGIRFSEALQKKALQSQKPDTPKHQTADTPTSKNPGKPCS